MGKDPSHARNLIALGHKWLVTIAASRPGESTVPVASELHDLILLILNILFRCPKSASPHNWPFER